MSNGLIWVSQAQVGRAHKYKACKSTSSAQVCKSIHQHKRHKKSTCTSTSKKEHSAECVLSAIILGWDEG